MHTHKADFSITFTIALTVQNVYSMELTFFHRKLKLKRKQEQEARVRKKEDEKEEHKKKCMSGMKDEEEKGEDKEGEEGAGRLK